jgi:hypothetical protein
MVAALLHAGRVRLSFFDSAESVGAPAMLFAALYVASGKR